MSERSTDTIRAEIAVERQLLEEDIARLQSEIRSVAVFAAASLVIVGLVTWRMGKKKGAQTIWKLVK
jgi:hypothetical protein